MARFRITSLLLAALPALLLLPACTPPDAPPAALTITDDLGREVALARLPRRIVTLAPSLTEVVFAAGAGSTVAGVTPADDFPAAVDTLPRFSALPMDFEAIAALRPDLALATDQVNNPRDAETLHTLGIPTVFLSFRSLEDIYRGIRHVGAWLGTADQAEAAADSLERLAQGLQAATRTMQDRPLVLFLIGDDTLYAFGRDSYIHALIELAGGRSATGDLETQAPILDDEFVLIANPEVIIGAFGPDYDPATLLEKHPTWSSLDAVRQGRVYSLDPDLVLRPGPRLLEAGRQMAALLHPGVLVEAP